MLKNQYISPKILANIITDHINQENIKKKCPVCGKTHNVINSAYCCIECEQKYHETC